MYGLVTAVTTVIATATTTVATATATTTAATVTTATTTVTAAATAATTVTTSATTAEFGLRTSFIDSQRTAFELLAIQGLRCSVCLRRIPHLNKTESFGTACFTIYNYLSRFDGSIGSEQFVQFCIGHLVGQIAYVQTLHNANTPTLGNSGTRPIERCET
jgi:ABC-type transport system substrate-binding protein